MRLCSYVVKIDKGFAPNPFWGYCTVAVCTPNHMRICLQNCDWLIGTTSVTRGNKLLYAMKVTEVLYFDDYYRDIRFKKKIPNKYGNWQEMCGDNIYYKYNNEWRQHSTIYHNDENEIKKDLINPYVFVSKHFYYFGNNAIEFPKEYQILIKRKQGCKCKHNPETINRFLEWLHKNYKPGVLGEPYDINKTECDNCN